jgi:uncharacterized damage-inducible protein DinB
MQMSLNPDQAKVLLNSSFLPWLNAEHPVTKRVVAAIPVDKGDYRPDDIGKSAIDLAWHIVTAENRFLEAVINGAFDFTPPVRPDAIQTGEALNAYYSDRFSKNIDRLKQLTGDQLVRIIDFRGIFQFPAVIYAQLGLSHSIHHRGQLSMYLRPMGAKVPSIYGESYDARIARESRA